MVSQRPTPEHGSGAAFRMVALAAVTVAIGQVALGGVVRVTDSGLGCPDWPLCFGKVVPPLEFSSIVEYSHRLSGTLLGVLVLATTGMACRSHRDDFRVTGSSTLALALVVLAALLGGAAVLTELDWWVVLLHLGIAELVVACLVVASVAGWKAGDRSQNGRPRAQTPTWFSILVASVLVGAFVLILSGSYMVGLGYGSACATWPLCRGALVPEGGPYAIHMAHRIVAAAVGLLIASTAASAWPLRLRRPELWRAALLTGGLFLVQVAVGAATVWAGFTAPLKSAHLVTATLVWASLVFLASLNFPPRSHRLHELPKNRPPLGVKRLTL